MELKDQFDGGVLQEILKDQPLFKSIPVRQQLPVQKISPSELPGKMNAALQRVIKRIRPGMHIGITVGSRGIDQMVLTLRLLVDAIKREGAVPYLVPCMGSHGYTAAGQRLILEGLGVTEESVGAPVVSKDDLVLLQGKDGAKDAWIDRFLYECDGIIVLNRIKPHTAFHGPVESGLQKMIAVGMGKQRGASACHKNGFADMANTVMRTAQTVLATQKILFGVAIIENANGELAILEGVPAEEIGRREPELLLQAKEMAPSLPFDSIDLLIVDEMGKNISGSGMDTNVIGRYPTEGMTGGPKVKQLVVLSLTAASEGSGHGMGFADLISARLFHALRLESTYPNGLTNRTCAPAKIPPIMPNDKMAIQAGIRCCALNDPSEIRAVRIRNTHDLSELYVSPAMLKQSKRLLTILDSAKEIAFDENGVILDEWSKWKQQNAAL